MPALRTVRVTRYVTPLREGGSLPAIVEADDDGMYVLKFRGAGQGPRALIAELVSGELARALDLPVPELVLAGLDADLARTEKDASRKLGEASTSMRENRLRDKIRYSRSLIRSPRVSSSDASTFEQEIGNNIGDVQKKLADAAAALGQTKPDATTTALDKARELARGMESLDQRMRERTGQQGQQGQ